MVISPNTCTSVCCRLLLGACLRAFLDKVQLLLQAYDEQLQLFRQLYDRCREQHGDTDEQTRMLLELISRLESQPSPPAG